MTIREATKKQVTITTIEFDGNNADEIATWMGEENYVWDDDNLLIVTLEGNMKVTKGDFVIKGVEGEFYPCKPDIFAKTYDLA